MPPEDLLMPADRNGRRIRPTTYKGCDSNNNTAILTTILRFWQQFCNSDNSIAMQTRNPRQSWLRDSRQQDWALQQLVLCKNKWKSEPTMTPRVLKQDPNTYKFQKNAVYLDKTQPTNIRCNPLYQATKRHLNNNHWTPVQHNVAPPKTNKWISFPSHFSSFFIV